MGSRWQSRGTAPSLTQLPGQGLFPLSWATYYETVSWSNLGGLPAGGSTPHWDVRNQWYQAKWKGKGGPQPMERPGGREGLRPRTREEG